jgi:hypothetical protein
MNLQIRKYNSLKEIFKDFFSRYRAFKTLINRAAIVSKHVDIVNEKSFDVERFSGQYRRERRGASIFTKNNNRFLIL